LPERKPHPAPLLHALRALGASPGDAVYVGDSEVDLEAAANAGLPFLCVGWGRAAGRVADPLARFADLPGRIAAR
jgi:phosphoglycolate phosphatase